MRLYLSHKDKPVSAPSHDTEAACLRKQSVHKEKSAPLITGIAPVSFLTPLPYCLGHATPHPTSGELRGAYWNLRANLF